MSYNSKITSRGCYAVISALCLTVFAVSIASAVVIHGEISKMKPFLFMMPFLNVAGLLVSFFGVMVAINSSLIWFGFVCNMRLVIMQERIIMYSLLFVTAVVGSFIIVKAYSIEENLVKNEIEHAMMLYRRNDSMARNIDDIQNTLKCCGAYGYQDWRKYSMEMETFWKPLLCRVPQSCCAERECVPAECLLVATKKSPVFKANKPVIRKRFQKRTRGKFHSSGCISKIIDKISGIESSIVQCTFQLVLAEITCICLLHILVRIMAVQAFMMYSVLAVPRRSAPITKVRPHFLEKILKGMKKI